MNVAARLVKLEARRHRPNEVLLIWRRPDGDVRAAANKAKFAPGDRVICVEWFGDSPLPAPRWFRESSELDAIEKASLTQSLTRLAAGDRPGDPGFAEVPPVSGQRARELADNDLLHMAFGIAT